MLTRDLVVRAKQEIEDASSRSESLQLIETVIIYKLRRFSREEIQTVFALRKRHAARLMKPPLRLQFTLRTLFIATLAVAVVTAWYAGRYRQMRRAANMLEKHGASFSKGSDHPVVRPSSLSESAAADRRDIRHLQHGYGEHRSRDARAWHRASSSHI